MAITITRAFDPTVLLNCDLSRHNFEATSTEKVLLFSYGANMTPNTLLSRLKTDWDELTIEMLETHFLGLYKVPNMDLAFNKHGGTQSYANIFVRKTTEVYGTVCAIPKRILYDANSNLNIKEGCKGIITNNEQGHYWLRQLPYPAHPVGDVSRHPSMTTGLKHIPEGIWFYQATPDKTQNEDNAMAPSKEYANKIYEALSDLGGVSPEYLAKIKKYC
jgi:hypothetical protein